MVKLIHFLLIVSCLSACLCEVLEFPPEPKPKPNSTTAAPPTTSPTSTTVTPAPTTTSTTPKSTTTPTTTPKPTTTTPTTTTPTTTTTTTETPTTTTTSTTTVAPITTTEKPTPTPEPTTGTWNVTEKNVTCIIAQMALQANVTYFTKTGNNTALINLPSQNKTTVSGHCGNISQVLVISWDINNSLTLNFTKNETSKFMLSELILNITTQGPHFPNSNGTQIVASLKKHEFITPISMSYKCDRDETLALTRGNDTMAIVTVRHLQLEAFHTQNNTKFSTAQECWSPTPDIVPIAVGCALAGLVIIVLAGYLIGRRRATARGYLSM